MSENIKETNENTIPFAVSKRRGRFTISRHLLLNSDENTLREIFSNFFPIDIDRHHDINFWDSIVYYGISPHFEEVDEGTLAYDYILYLKDVDGVGKFERFEKKL